MTPLKTDLEHRILELDKSESDGIVSISASTIKFIRAKWEFQAKFETLNKEEREALLTKLCWLYNSMERIERGEPESHPNHNLTSCLVDENAFAFYAIRTAEAKAK